MATKGFEEERVLKLRLHDMRIGEAYVNDDRTTKVECVPGGWVYYSLGFNAQTICGVFVPRPLTTVECW